MNHICQPHKSSPFHNWLLPHNHRAFITSSGRHINLSITRCKNCHARAYQAKGRPTMVITDATLKYENETILEVQRWKRNKEFTPDVL